MNYIHLVHPYHCTATVHQVVTCINMQLYWTGYVTGLVLLLLKSDMFYIPKYF